MRYVANNKGELIVIGRSCEVVIHDDVGQWLVNVIKCLTVRL